MIRRESSKPDYCSARACSMKRNGHRGIARKLTLLAA
jgi:hypothetical protein